MSPDPAPHATPDRIPAGCDHPPTALQAKPADPGLSLPGQVRQLPLGHQPVHLLRPALELLIVDPELALELLPELLNVHPRTVTAPMRYAQAGGLVRAGLT